MPPKIKRVKEELSLRTDVALNRRPLNKCRSEQLSSELMVFTKMSPGTKVT